MVKDTCTCVKDYTKGIFLAVLIIIDLIVLGILITVRIINYDQEVQIDDLNKTLLFFLYSINTVLLVYKLYKRS